MSRLCLKAVGRMSWARMHTVIVGQASLDSQQDLRKVADVVIPLLRSKLGAHADICIVVLVQCASQHSIVPAIAVSVATCFLSPRQPCLPFPLQTHELVANTDSNVLSVQAESTVIADEQQETFEDDRMGHENCRISFEDSKMGDEESGMFVQTGFLQEC